MLSVNKKLVIFDLDGTILDTIRDIAAAVNRASAKYGSPAHTVAEIQSFLGNGSLVLMRRVLGEDASDELCRTVRELFRKEYNSDMYSNTVPYQGIKELMAELGSRGAIIAVVTNKDHFCAVPMIEHYFGGLVQEVRGVTGDTDRKPNPDNILALLKKLGISADEALMVGDGMADLNVSKNAEMEFVPVGYGYTSGEKLFAQCGTEPCMTVAQLREKLLSYFPAKI